MNELKELLAELKERLAESKKLTMGFNEFEGAYIEGQEAELESIIDLIEKRIN